MDLAPEETAEEADISDRAETDAITQYLWILWLRNEGGAAFASQ